MVCFEFLVEAGQTLTSELALYRMLTLVAVAAISTSGTVAPRVEIYTRTVCQVYDLGLDPDECRADLKVQATTAQLMAVISAMSGFLSTVTAAWWGSVRSIVSVVLKLASSRISFARPSCQIDTGGCGCWGSMSPASCCPI